MSAVVEDLVLCGFVPGRHSPAAIDLPDQSEPTFDEVFARLVGRFGSASDTYVLAPTWLDYDYEPYRAVRYALSTPASGVRRVAHISVPPLAFAAASAALSKRNPGRAPSLDELVWTARERTVVMGFARIFGGVHRRHLGPKLKLNGLVLRRMTAAIIRGSSARYFGWEQVNLNPGFVPDAIMLSAPARASRQRAMVSRELRRFFPMCEATNVPSHPISRQYWGSKKYVEVAFSSVADGVTPAGRSCLWCSTQSYLSERRCLRCGRISEERSQVDRDQRLQLMELSTPTHLLEGDTSK